MIAKLEWTKSNAQQNIEKILNPTMGVTIVVMGGTMGQFFLSLKRT